MKILYLTARQPYPVTKGDQIIAYNQIKELSKEHDVYLFTFYEGDENLLVKEMKKYCKKIYTFEDNTPKKIISMMKTIIKPISIQANCFFRYSVLKKLNEVIDFIEPDVVHVQSFRMAEYLYKRNIKKSIGLIDAYSLNMKKRAMKTKGVLRLLWKLEGILLSKYEKKIIADYKFKTIVAERDRAYLKDESIIVNPNGVWMNEEILKSVKERRNSEDINMVFHGNMSYYPNVEAVKILKNKVFPQIREAYDIKAYIVGGNPCKEIMNIKDENFNVTGYVENIEEYLGIADIALHPMVSATGLQNKVLEAMAAGVPTVISEECARGIPGIKDGFNTYIAKDENDYFKYTRSILDDDKKKNYITGNALEFVRDYYSWEKNVLVLVKSWEKL